MSRDLGAVVTDYILAQICYALGLHELADELADDARRQLVARPGNELLDYEGKP